MMSYSDGASRGDSVSMNFRKDAVANEMGRAKTPTSVGEIATNTVKVDIGGEGVSRAELSRERWKSDHDVHGRARS